MKTRRRKTPIDARRAEAQEVIDILNRELLQIMRQAGTPALASITRERVIASTWR